MKTEGVWNVLTSRPPASGSGTVNIAFVLVARHIWIGDGTRLGPGSPQMALLVLTALLALAASARASPSCADVSESMRFDCHPEANPNEADCEARGCCWIADRSTTAKMGLPSCFYPSDFGYTATDMHATATGMSGTLKLTGKGGPYGGDVKTLTLDVHEETPFRLHVKVGAECANALRMSLDLHGL